MKSAAQLTAAPLSTTTSLAVDKVNKGQGRIINARLAVKIHLEHKVAEQLDAAKEQARKLSQATEALVELRQTASSRQFEK